MVLRLDLRGRLVTDGRVDAFPIVEDLDVFEDGGAQVAAGRPSGAINKLSLQRREEALGNCVVPAVALAAHADLDAELGERCLVLGARVLAATVGVVKKASAGPTTADG